MNETVQPKNDREEPKKSFPSEEKKIQLLSVLALPVCCAAYPLCGYEWASAIVLALLFAYTVLVMKNPGAVLALLIPTVFIAAFTSTFGAGALLLALTLSIGILAYLITASQWGALALLVPLASVPVVYFSSGDVLAAVLPLVSMPAALLLAIATRRKMERTRAILFAEAGLLLVTFGGAYYLLSRAAGNAGVEIGAYLHEGIYSLFISFRTQLAAVFAEMPTADAKAVEELMLQLSDANLRDLAASVTNLLPAAVCAVCSLIAYQAQYFVLGACFRSGRQEYLTDESRTFTMSLPAAIIFFVSTVLSMFMKVSMAQAVFASLSLILLPGFLLLGGASIGASLRRTRGGARTFMFIMIVSLFCCVGINSVYCLALYGAYGVVMSAVEKRLLKKLGSQDDNHNSDDPL